MKYLSSSLATLSTASILVLSTATQSVLADNVLSTGERLNANEEITSNNGFFSLKMQNDGNLVLRRWDTVLWRSGSATTGSPKLSMQSDNNIVIYDTPTWNSVWSAGTWNSGATALYIQNDGNVVARKSNGTPVWSTGTWQFDMSRLLSGLGNSVAMQLRTADSNNYCLTNFTAGGYWPSYANINGVRRQIAHNTSTSNIAGYPVEAESCNYQDSLNGNWQYSQSSKQISLTYSSHSKRWNVEGSGVSTSEYDKLNVASAEEQLCLDIDSASPTAGDSVITNLCDALSPTQRWEYNSTTKQLSSLANPSLCASYGATVIVENCASASNAKWAAFAL